MRLFRRNMCKNTVTLAVVFGFTFTVALHWWLGGSSRAPPKTRVLKPGDININDLPKPSYEFPGYVQYAQALKASTSNDKTVILTMVDSGYIDLAYNFYVSSVLKHDLENVLFVALDSGACEKIRGAFSEPFLHCFVYKEVEGAGHPSLYASWEFKNKVYLRRFFVLEAIKLGYDVMMTDLDVIFRENPLPDIKKTCARKKCDLAATWDDHLETYNTGFMYIRSTPSSINFYERLATYEMSHGVGQTALNAALRHNTGKHAIPLNLAPLSHEKYRVGISLFPHNNCPDQKEYEGVVVIHNNYIIEEHNKIYRFKQCMLWEWDGFDGYYTDPERQYLTVGNIGLTGSNLEHQTLLNAFSVAKLLKRTVILPRFECNTKKCNLLQRIYDHSHLHFVKRLDNATQGGYRESSFLRNPRVPVSTKTSLSPVVHIANSHDHAETLHKQFHGEKVHVVVPKNPDLGPTEHELMQWFAKTDTKVLRFESLHGNYAHIKHSTIIGEELVKIIRQL